MFDLSTQKTGPLRRVRTRHGDFLTLASDSAGIGALLSYYGEYAQHEVALLEALTKPGDTVIDVGANIGTHTIPLARHISPAGRIIAFEAQPVIAMLLEANLALNDIGWVEVRLAAAGAVAGHISLPTVDYTQAGQNFGGVSLVGARTEAMAPMQKLDDLGADPTLIKVDVEGMELDVLKGAAALITALRPVLYIENFPAPGSDEVLVWLRDHDYALFWDVQPLHSAGNFRGQTQPFFWNGLTSNVLALPPGRIVDPGAFGLEAVQNIHDHKFLRALAELEHLRPA